MNDTTKLSTDNRDMHAMEGLYLAKIDALYAELARAYQLIEELRRDVFEAERGK